MRPLAMTNAEIHAQSLAARRAGGEAGLPPAVWVLWGLCLLWASLAAMDWWGVMYEDRYPPALTLQSLWLGEGWTIDLLDLRNVTPSPLAPLLGQLLMTLLPSAPAVLWAMSLAGLGLLGLGMAVSRWAVSPAVGHVVGLWGFVLWATHPLALSSLGMNWLLPLGILAVGCALLEARWEKTGWLLLGVAIVGRAEIALGWLGALLWRCGRRREWTLTPWWTLAWLAPLLWGVSAWVVFGRPWPATWASAWALSRSGILGPQNEYFAYLTRQFIATHPVWFWFLAALASVGILTLRHAPALAWAGGLLGAGCLAIHGGLHLAAGEWWWLYLGPLMGFTGLGILGLAWLLDRGRPFVTRALGIAAAVVVLGAQWRSEWPLEDWATLRGESLSWEEAAQWVRQHTTGRSRIATTQPATLMWHLGIAHREPMRWVEPLIGPLVKRGPRAPSPEHQPLEILRALEADPEGRPLSLLVLRAPQDAIWLNAIASDANTSRQWRQVHQVRGPGGRRLVILGRQGEDLAPAAFTPEPDPEAVAAANAVLEDALREAAAWLPAQTTQVHSAGHRIALSDNSHDGFVWTPWISVPAGAVEAIEITMNVAAETELPATVLQLWWKGTDADGREISQYQHAELLVTSDWVLRPHRFELGSNPLWRQFHTVRRLRIDPAPFPFRATIAAVRLIPAEADL